MPDLTSRERLVRALRHQPPDYVPYCFMSLTALRRRCQENLYELVKTERAMGLDSFLFIPTLSRPQRPDHPELRGLPVRFHPAVGIRERREEVPSQHAALHKEYSTPGGKLQTSVHLSDDWHMAITSLSWTITRCRAPSSVFSQATRWSWKPSRYLLTPPQSDDIAQFKGEAERAHPFTREQGVLLAGGWDAVPPNNLQSYLWNQNLSPTGF